MSVTHIDKAHEYREQKKSHQTDNGYLKLCNEINLDLARATLSMNERRVLQVVFAYTYGYQKKWGRITFGLIATITGIDIKRVGKICRKMIRGNIISRRFDEEDNQELAYQKYTEKWLYGMPEKQVFSQLFDGDTPSPSGDTSGPPDGDTSGPPDGDTSGPPNKDIYINKTNKENTMGCTPKNAAPDNPKKPSPKKTKKSQQSSTMFWDLLPDDLKARMQDRNCNAKAFAERYPDFGFLLFATAYPQRAGSQRWQMAKAAYNARLKEGFTEEQIEQAAERYRLYCEHNRLINTPMTKQAATFLGDPENIELPWSLDHAKRNNKQSTNPAFVRKQAGRSVTTSDSSLRAWAGAD